MRTRRETGPRALTAWKRRPSHRGLCTNLPDLKIVAVRLTDFNNFAITFVPVSRIAKVSAGDDVLLCLQDDAD
jgi:hypothetical protein